MYYGIRYDKASGRIQPGVYACSTAEAVMLQAAEDDTYGIIVSETQLLLPYRYRVVDGALVEKTKATLTADTMTPAAKDMVTIGMLTDDVPEPSSAGALQSTGRTVVIEYRHADRQWLVTPQSAGRVQLWLDDDTFYSEPLMLRVR